MEQTTELQIPQRKIYPGKAIWLGSFVGGPLVAGYLIAENFKSIGEKDKVKTTWFFTVLATIVIFGGIFLIPNADKIPRQIIPLTYTAIAFFIVQHYQGAKIESHIKSGGKAYNWGRTVVISILGLALTLLPIFGIAYMSDAAANASITTKKYGIMKHEIDFDKENVSEGEIDVIADCLTKTTFFDETVTKYVYVEKEDDKYEISISVIEGIENDNQVIELYAMLRKDIQVLLPDNKIILKLVTGSLDNEVKRIE